MINYRTNIDEVKRDLADSLMSLLPGGVVHERAMRASSSTLLGHMIVRIHTNGQASDGSEIGQYSTKPIYINPKNSPVNFATIGKYKDYFDEEGNRVLKPGEDTFKVGLKAGKKHTTKYFDGGYKEFRKEIGRPTGKVNLDLTGTLKQGLQVIIENGKYGIGLQNEELTKRVLGLEEKYGKPIYEATAEEEALFIETFESEMNNGIHR